MIDIFSDEVQEAFNREIATEIAQDPSLIDRVIERLNQFKLELAVQDIVDNGYAITEIQIKKDDVGAAFFNIAGVNPVIEIHVKAEKRNDNEPNNSEDVSSK